jgi:transcriptional regulator with XRE-family HTH domain
MGAISETLSQISEKIRELRTDRGITLKEMSAVTGLSISFLSQVERGTSSLAIQSLEKIAEALDVPISEFFSEPDRQKYMVRQDDRREFQIESSRATYASMAGRFFGRKLDPLIVELPSNFDDGKLYNHPGEEFYFVMDGEVIFTIEEDEYHLKDGDTIHFPSETDHRWRNPLDKPCKLLCIVTPIIF